MPAENLFLKTRYQPFICLLIALLLLYALAVFGPQQLPVVVYKLIMPLLGGSVGCFIWLTLLPYANPSRYLARNWRDDPDADVPGGPDFAVVEGYEAVFCVCLVSLTCAIVAGMLAVAWGL